MAAKSVNVIASKAAAAGLTEPKQLVAFTLGFASGKKSQLPSSKPKMYYWPIAGRAELCRLIAAAGGLDIDESPKVPDDKAAYGSKSGIPLLEHGDLKMSQSLAIERYLADIAPKFAGLTPQQRGVDGMLAGIKEDMIATVAKTLFGDKSGAPKAIPEYLGKIMPVVERLCPASGFINGLSFPTVADLAVLNIRLGYMPFGAVYKLVNDKDPEGTELFAAYPKFNALVKRTSEAAGVKEYLAASKSLTGAFPGF